MIPKTFSIGDTSKLSGTSKKQIRNWEAKGHIPEAERVVCGDRAYRRFTKEQVEIIRNIKSYLEEGFTLKAAAEKTKNSNLNRTRKKSTRGGIY